MFVRELDLTGRNTRHDPSGYGIRTTVAAKSTGRQSIYGPAWVCTSAKRIKLWERRRKISCGNAAPAESRNRTIRESSEKSNKVYSCILYTCTTYLLYRRARRRKRNKQIFLGKTTGSRVTHNSCGFTGARIVSAAGRKDNNIRNDDGLFCCFFFSVTLSQKLFPFFFVHGLFRQRFVFIFSFFSIRLINDGIVADTRCSWTLRRSVVVGDGRGREFEYK